MERKWWTLVAVVGGIFMLLLDVTIVNVALPDIERALDASLADLQWVIDAYALTLAALLLTAGSLADRYGRRLLFAIGIVVFTLGSLLCGLAPSATFLSLARAFQGVGGAIMFATGLALLSDAFHGKDRGVAFGVFGAITGVAVAVGPVLGGALTSRPVVALDLPRQHPGRDRDADRHAARGRRVARPARAAGRLPRPGHLQPRPRRARLRADPLERGRLGRRPPWSARWSWPRSCWSRSWSPRRCSASRCSTSALFRKPTFVGGLIAAFAISASLFSAFPYLVIYMQTGLGLSAIEVGVRFLVLSGPIFITAAIAGRLSDRVPPRLLIGPGFALVGISLLLMRGIEPGMTWTHLIPGFIVAGIGAGLINVPLASTAVGVVEPARAGMASGINSTLRQVGIATGVAALGAIFSHQAAGAQRPLTGFVDGLNAILLVGAVLALVAAATSLVLIRQARLRGERHPA